MQLKGQTDIGVGHVGGFICQSPVGHNCPSAKPAKHRDGGGEKEGEGAQLKPNTDFLQPSCVENGNCSFQNRCSCKHSTLFQQDDSHKYNLRLINVSAVARLLLTCIEFCQWANTLNQGGFELVLSFQEEMSCSKNTLLLDPISLQFELYRNQRGSFNLFLCVVRFY